MTESTSTQISERTSYDETPYPSKAFRQTHPNRLAAMARLFGMDAPAPSKARVLELGCADGSNLLPMAEMAPEASFLGIDASQVQIAEGLRAVEGAGLKNVELRRQDIMDFSADAGKFDYIIAHGVFSWVPAPVREKIFAICREHLAERGVAYVSYNALPGWNMRKSLRDVMLYHTRLFKDSETKVQQARAVLGFIGQSVPAEGSAYGQLLQSELGAIASSEDGFLRHDLLEEENTAFYFHDFIAQAGRYSLHFLSEPSLFEMLAGNFPEKISKKLAEVGPTVVAQEQYMDFLKNRQFRQTLLCRREVTLSRTIDPNRLKGLAFQSLIKAAAGAGTKAPKGTDVFVANNGAEVKVSDPFLKAALQLLARHGARAVSYAELFGTAQRATEEAGVARTEAQSAAEDASLATALVNLVSKGLVEIFAEPVASALAAPAKPLVSPMTRFRAMRGQLIVNRVHQPVGADGFVRNLVALCDGTRTGDELLEAMVMRAQQGELNVSEAGRPVTDATRLRALLTPRVSSSVKILAATGFFAP